MPRAEITLSVPEIRILGVGLYHGAYIAEVVRKGIGAVSKGLHDFYFGNHW